MLILPIQKKWFDMILSGEKREEYRDITDYWKIRFRNAWYNFQIEGTHLYPYHQPEIPSIEEFMELLRKEPQELPVELRNGYRIDSRMLVLSCHLKVGEGKEEWGAVPGKEYFVLDIKDISKLYR